MATILILLRHAKPDDMFTGDDDLRPITEEGKQIQKEVCIHLRKNGFSPTKVYYSPLTRTTQTAEVVSSFFDIAGEPMDALGLEFDPQRLIALLPSPEFDEVVLFVGHAPSLLHFAEQLVGASLPVRAISRSSAIILRVPEEIGLKQAQFVTYFDSSTIPTRTLFKK